MQETVFQVNFDYQLFEIISETKYMEKLAFSVPELARNVALQVSRNKINKECFEKLLKF